MNSLLASYSTVITLNDVIDVAIVTFLVYKILSWIKETRAWSLYKGIIVIVVISALAKIFALNTISWIISVTFNVGLISIIVLFQPECRKALEQLGKVKFASKLYKSESTGHDLTENSIKEILQAINVMARTHTGAIIIIQNEVPLGDLENTGVHIDGVITSQLLINIFENKTPLHDGAVIIKDNRISAAACILPLTQTQINQELGTRHRAGIGASEVSDAYVLIISEERGEISFAKGGKFYRNISENKLTSILFSLLKNNSPKIKNFRLWKGRDNNEKTD